MRTSQSIVLVVDEVGERDRVLAQLAEQHVLNPVLIADPAAPWLAGLGADASPVAVLVDLRSAADALDVAAAMQCCFAHRVPPVIVFVDASTPIAAEAHKLAIGVVSRDASAAELVAAAGRAGASMMVLAAAPALEPRHAPR